MKYNSPGAFSNFEAEAIGLEEIAGSRTIGSAVLLGLGKDQTCSFLLQEFIAGGPRIKDYWQTFARELAAMHKAPVSHAEVGYGFFMDNYIGMRKQINTPHDRWIPFFRDCRLKPQFEAAAEYFGPSEGNDGKGWLIDPAVYYGHPEADLAMTELFGGFPDSFYEAYKEFGNLSSGYKDRRDLYNLYQLLNHLNMFGGGYYSAVRNILNRYA